MGSPFSFCYVKGYPLAKDNCPGVTRCQRVPGRVDRRARQVQGYLTIKEAAERLGISERTVRRRIKEGSLSAELRLGQYGQQYFIKADVIETAQAITDVVEVKKVHDGQALSLAIVKALEGRDKALGGELAAIREELAVTRKALEQLKNELSQQQEQQARPWWQRLFGK